MMQVKILVQDLDAIQLYATKKVLDIIAGSFHSYNRILQKQASLTGSLSLNNKTYNKWLPQLFCLGAMKI